MNLFNTKGASGEFAPGKKHVMKRCYVELERTKRVHRMHIRFAHFRSLRCECEFQVGRFRKKKALGCGRSHCKLCHFEKIFDVPSAADRVREQQFDDSLKDYLAGK
jgi:hypothetical protein